jgi:hypothetical protein
MGGQMATGVTLRNDLVTLMDEIDFSELGLTGDKILPGLSVDLQAAAYPVLPREARMKVPNTSRAPNGTFQRGEWSWGSATYTCEEFGFEELVDLTQKKENQRWIDEEEVSAQLAVGGLMLARESRIASALFNATTFTGATNFLDITTQWDKAAATCLADVNAAWIQIRGKTGLPKHLLSLILSDDLVDYALQTTLVVSSVMYTSPVATMPIAQKRAFLATYLGVKEVIPVASLYDTAAYNKDAVIGKFWSNEYAMLCKLSSGINSFREGCIGRQPIWTPYSTNYILEDYPEANKNARVIRAREYRGITINTDYGFLLGNMKETVNSTTGI